MRRTLVAAIAATLAFVVLTSAAEARSLPLDATSEPRACAFNATAAGSSTSLAYATTTGPSRRWSG
jgi:hypothetical protein